MSLRRSSRTSIPKVNGEAGGAFLSSSSVSIKRLASTTTSSPGGSKKVRISSASKGAGANTTAITTKDSANGSDDDFKKPPAPATPSRRRGGKTVRAPPLTPTPSLVHALRAPYSSGDIDDTTPPPPLNRPVEPHVSNATLVTPGGTQNVAFPNGPLDSTPSKTGLPRPTATTGTLLEKACAHLIKVDPRMRSVINQYPCSVFSAKGLAEEIDPFRSLSSGIMGQQVSGAAAKSIKNKFVALFNDPESPSPSFPTPADVAKADIATLRTAGLSQRKAEYIKGLAEKFVSGELTTNMLMKATDEEVMERLIAVRGLGRWSVEMFACFGLKRLDILSTGDLGVQRGMAAFFGKDVKKLKAKGGGKWKYMSEQDMLDKSAAFSPYRSLFMWYMWRVEDVDVDVMQNGT